jgi:hypothetical protein
VNKFRLEIWGNAGERFGTAAILGGFLMKSFVLAACLYLVVSVPSALADEMHFDFNWQVRIGCDGPTVSFPVRDWPAEVNGKASLLTNGSTSMELAISGFAIPTGILSWHGRLGGRPTTTPGGTAELRVAGPHSLRATWRQPHNDIFMVLNADRQSCSMSVDVKLHPGQTVYTLYNGRNYENCPEIRIVQATCKAY